MMDKLMFWKKEPEINLDPSIDMGPSNSGMETFSQPPSFDSINNPGLPNDPMAGLPPQPQPDPVLDNNFGGDNRYNQPSYDRPRIVNDPMVQQPNMNDGAQKNMEIISMKLDNLKIAIENMNQRLQNIERIAQESQAQPPKRPNW